MGAVFSSGRSRTANGAESEGVANNPNHKGGRRMSLKTKAKMARAGSATGSAMLLGEANVSISDTTQHLERPKVVSARPAEHTSLAESSQSLPGAHAPAAASGRRRSINRGLKLDANATSKKSKSISDTPQYVAPHVVSVGTK